MGTHDTTSYHGAGTGRPAIRTPDQRLRVFVSSTLGELAEERRAARAAITNLRLTPVLFELGARPHPPRELYRAYLSQSDVFIGIYWERYGWVAPGMEISGLEDEYLLSGRLPRLIYIKEPAPGREARLQALLDRVRADDGISYQKFATAEELHELVQNDLALLLTERFTTAPDPSAANPGGTSDAGREEGARPVSDADAWRAAVPLFGLPTAATALIGRDAELDRATRQILRDDVRLLTITGAGGTGKTRLALELAERLQPQFPDGVYFVDLAPFDDPSRVLPTIGRHLGIADSNQRSILDAIRGILYDRRLLLVLDNFERVLDAARYVGEILDSVPGVKVVVTSREPLRLRREHEFPLPPLSVPDEAGLYRPEDLAGVPAVALFVERARAVLPDFALNETNAGAVAEICRRLDGLPLAIELAVPRLKVLPPAALMARLGRRLDLLRSTTRDAPGRHRTLREAIRWSYELLSPEERALFRRMAVFSGGCTLDALQAVCAGEGLLADETLDVLYDLVGKSLVVVDAGADGTARYRLLETLREYGLEELDAAHETERLRERHRDWCLSLARQAVANFWTPELPTVLDGLERDRNNIRAALDWTAATGRDVEKGLEIAGLLSLFWDVHGLLREGQERLETLLALPGAAARTPGRARALDALGWLVALQGGFDVGKRYLEEANAVWRELNEPNALGWSLGYHAMIAYNLPDVELAGALFQESVAVARRTGDRPLEGWSTFGRGHLAWFQGDVPLAQRYLHQALGMAREVGMPWGTAWAEFSLSVLAFLQGDHEQAMTRQQTSLRLRYAMRDKRCMTDSLGVMACLAAVQGRHDLAVRLLGAVEVLREASGAKLLPWLEPIHAQGIAQAREALGEARFKEVWAEGRSLSVDDVVAYALTVDAPPAAAPAAPPADPALAALTRREREVAALIARGLTSREIADRLVISERTVDVHADHIRAKLDLRSRAEIAAWAAEHGLRADDADHPAPPQAPLPRR